MIFHCYGMLKATKKSISLLQSNCPLIKTIECLLSRADINKLVQLLSSPY